MSSEKDNSSGEERMVELTEPNFENIKKFADALGITVEEFINDLLSNKIYFEVYLSKN